MGDKIYSVKESQLSSIAEHIRAKASISDSLSFPDGFNSAIDSIIAGGTGNFEEISINSNGVYTPSSGYDAISKASVEVYSTPVIQGFHTNNKKWSFPAEYHQVIDDVDYDNNIELIPIDRENNEQVLYFLYDCRNINSFCRLRAYGTTVQADIGFCKDGVFTSVYSQSVSSGGYFTKWLDDIGYDFIIVRIKAVKLTQCYPASWSATTDHPSALPASCNTILMRYGNLPYGTNITCASITLESDNVTDFAKMLSGTALTLVSAYAYNYKMQRWRCDGWNVANNKTTSLSSMFNSCYMLNDVPASTDFSGWCSASTTSTTSFMSYCRAWASPIICNNWNLSACTSIASTFNECRSLPYIYGIETWVGGGICTNAGNMFGVCMNLSNETIDLSGMTFTSKLTSVSNMFSTCYSIQFIKLSDLDFTNVTKADSMFANCYSLKSVSHGTITPPLASKLTTVASIFYCCYSMESVDFIKGWDLTNALINSMFTYMYSVQDSRNIDLSGTVFSSKQSAYSSNSNPMCNMIGAKYIDQSWVDCSVDTSSAKYLTTSMLAGCNNCIEFYPPQNIALYSFSISVSNKLSHDSLIRVMEALPTISTSLKLTMGSVNLAKLTADEKAIATNKGWTLG